MLSLVGMILALAGAVIYILTIHLNSEGVDNAQKILIAALGLTATIYIMMTSLMSTLIESPRTDAGLEIMLLGMVGFFANTGRSLYAPKLMARLKRNNKEMARCMILLAMEEPLLIYTLMIFIIGYSSLPEGLSGEMFKNAMLYSAAGSSTSALLLGIMLSRTLPPVEEKLRESFKKLVLYSLFSHLPGIGGLLFAILNYAPYLK